MERLRDQLGETISLYVRDGKERVRIQAVQSTQPIRRVAPVGVRLPLYVGASSKVLVAFAEDSVRQLIMSDPGWPAGLDRPQFISQLEETRKLGYAISIEEREPGAAAIAAPVFNRSHQLVAALAVSGPSNRLTSQEMLRHADALIESAKHMGGMLK